MGKRPTLSQLDRLRAEVEQAEPAFLHDLEKLVSIDCGSYSKAGVDEVADWMAARLAVLGASIERHGHDTLGDTVVATFQGRRAGPTVLMIGHMDTVFDEGTASERPYAVRDGRAVGPGVGDMKAGLLGGLYALSALRGLGALGDEGESWLPLGKVVFVVNPDEEIGSPSSTPIIKQLARDADVSLVLEGARANGDIVSARKGMMHFDVTITGRAAHAGVEPEKGRSATLEAAYKTLALHGLNGRWDGVSVNVGSIHGGSRPNIVADEAVITIDMRARDLATQQAARAAIEQVIETSTVADVTSAVEITAHHRPMEKHEASARLIETAVAVAADLGFELADTATGGGSDANTTSGLGIPTLDGLGPIAGGAHTPDDYIELASVVPRITLLAGLLLAIGQGRASS
ncbi:MAG: M20 family metallopeptidase [Chloroflexota bacterium]